MFQALCECGQAVTYYHCVFLVDAPKAHCMALPPWAQETRGFLLPLLFHKNWLHVSCPDKFQVVVPLSTSLHQVYHHLPRLTSLLSGISSRLQNIPFYQTHVYLIPWSFRAEVAPEFPIWRSLKQAFHWKDTAAPFPVLVPQAWCCYQSQVFTGAVEKLVETVIMAAEKVAGLSSV